MNPSSNPIAEQSYLLPVYANPTAFVDKSFETLELILDLGGEDYLDHFRYILASAKEGYATPSPQQPSDSMAPLLEMVMEHVPPPTIDADGPDHATQKAATAAVMHEIGHLLGHDHSDGSEDLMSSALHAGTRHILSGEMVDQVLNESH